MRKFSPGPKVLQPCRNGPSCRFLAKGNCFFHHPSTEQLIAGKTRRLRHQSNNLEDLVSTLALKCVAYERIFKILFNTNNRVFDAAKED